MHTITTIGLDIAKSVFQVHGIDAQRKGEHSPAAQVRERRAEMMGCRALCRMGDLPPVSGGTMPSHRREGEWGNWRHCRRHRSDGCGDGFGRLHASQKLPLGRYWFHCDHAGPRHERPREHCARKGTQRN
jgi:hypothetical protein